jgi:hypothetical protein
MYISSIPNRKSPPAVLLRESFRENGKVKNRTLANLSHWNPARIEALRRALRGDFDHVEPCEAALGPIFGLLYVLNLNSEIEGGFIEIPWSIFVQVAVFGCNFGEVAVP